MNTLSFSEQGSPIRVIGVGGAAVNAVNHMIDVCRKDVQFATVNSDATSMLLSRATRRMTIGPSVTRSLGCSGDPKLGQLAALESQSELAELAEGARVIFLVAGMGGGTGSGAAAIVAEEARKQGALVVAVATRPFAFEGTERAFVAEGGIQRLRQAAHALVVLENDQLSSGDSTLQPYSELFAASDEAFLKCVQGVCEIASAQSVFSLGRSDLTSILFHAGQSIVAHSSTQKEGHSAQATERALKRLQRQTSAEQIGSLAIGVATGRALARQEIESIAGVVCDKLGDDIQLAIGTVVDEKLGDKIRMTVMASDPSFKGKSAETNRRSMIRSHVVPQVVASRPWMQLESVREGAEGLTRTVNSYQGGLYWQTEVSNGNGNGNGHHANGNVHTNGVANGANGNGNGNGNGHYANGNGHSNGVASAAHSNGNGKTHANGNGNGHHANGNGKQPMGLNYMTRRLAADICSPTCVEIPSFVLRRLQ